MTESCLEIRPEFSLPLSTDREVTLIYHFMQVARQKAAWPEWKPWSLEPLLHVPLLCFQEMPSHFMHSSLLFNDDMHAHAHFMTW